MLAFSVGSPRLGFDSGAMWLHPTDLNRVEQILKQGRTITDEEMRRALNGVWERRRQLRLEATSKEKPVEGLAVGQ